ncbi:hypothetical protein [Actinocorallia sp. A-T 12471]|uniref:hypothetical protein n=1 Tax=Actinocorallia sp. A-T 12471 TaxID=3089813 RepID=UPI0029D09F3A|nr:hypothetical protein [Actinocorallia sp. A-T 12471]MDX6739297.1 hypothetical protein [Actinocorallia sp. A-T 12471]
MGTPVVVFSTDVPAVEADLGEGDGHPPGTPLLTGIHPQTLFFEGVPAATPKAAPTVLPAQDTLASFGPAWTGIHTLTDLLTAIRPALN